MVALVVSLILIAGVIQIFVGTRQTYRFQDALARVQENGRFAVEAIGRDARLAGYAGCTSLISVTPRVLAPTVPAIEYSRNNYVEGLASVAAGNPFGALPGTDVITLRMIAPNTARVDVDMGNLTELTLGANPLGFQVNDLLAIADCNNIDIFRVDGMAGLDITPNEDLSKAYLRNSLVGRYREVSYFIADGADGQPALWRRELLGVGGGGALQWDETELFQGVEDLWLRYGVDINNDGTPNIYVQGDAVPDINGDGVADWGRVRAMRISLLLASNEDNVIGAPQPVDFRGDVIVPGDNRFRQVLNTTIGLRNRLP